MEIYLLRHGLAVARGTPGFEQDALRPLTPKGQKQLQRVGRAMGIMKIEVDLILSSPWRRAHETALMVAAALQARKRIKLCEALAGDQEPADLIPVLQRLKPLPNSLLLVGHEPFLSQLISLWVTGGLRLGLDLPKAALCKLEWENGRSGQRARLQWLLTPSQMKKMAR